MTVLTEAQAARLALACLDLTSLKDDADAAGADALAARAATPFGAPAALCVWPRAVAAARRGLDARGLAAVRIATVVNFPQGEDEPATVAAQIDAARALGADEIDVVLPWRALRDGRSAPAEALLKACRAACRCARRGRMASAKNSWRRWSPAIR